MALRKALAIAGALLVEGACAVGPNFTRPQSAVPSAYKEGPAPVSAEWKGAEPRDASLRGKWWEAFSDPDLNALEEQIDVSNQTLAQAEAQFRAARAIARGARADFFPTVTASPSIRIWEGPEPIPARWCRSL